MDKLYAGIDLGTSGCRLMVIDQQKKIISQSRVAYDEGVEQSPKLWWNTVTVLLKKLDSKYKDALVSIAVDGTSGSILLVDKFGNPTSSTLMYNDLRATQEAEILKNIIPNDNGGQGASGSLARLMWLLKHEPNKNHAHAVHQADYILGKLANNFTLSDENNCLKLGYGVANQCWLKDEMSALGIPFSLLPNVVAAGVKVATIDSKQAKELGLPKQLSLVTGTTDSIAAFIATGADKLGEGVTSLGSTLVLKLICKAPIFSSEHGIYSHRLGNYWLVGGASNAGAKVLKQFFTQAQLDELTNQLNSEQLTGLDYYPLSQKGERFPVADVEKEPVLTPRPASDVEFFQGILEGIAKIEAQAYQKLTALGAPQLTSIRSVGGGSENKAWTQIRKNNLQVKMIEPQQTEAAYGSALLALKPYQHFKKATEQ